MTTGWCGLAEAADESRLGEESREEEGSEDREWGDIGLPSGETANISATKEPVMNTDADRTRMHAASQPSPRQSCWDWECACKTNAFIPTET